MKMAKLTTLIAALAILSACAGKSPETRLYPLDYRATEPLPELDGDRSIALVRLELAEYLEQPGLTMLERQNQIRIATFHVWGEGLRTALPRALTYDLAKACECTVSDPSMSGFAALANNRLEVRGDRFSATDTSQVVLSGRYWVIGKQGDRVERYFNLSSDLDQDGYEHAVSKMRELVSLLAERMVADLA